MQFCPNSVQNFLKFLPNNYALHLYYYAFNLHSIACKDDNIFLFLNALLEYFNISIYLDCFIRDYESI